MADSTPRRTQLLVLVIAALSGVLAFSVRSVWTVGMSLDVPAADAGGGPEVTWASYDPDTLYHARRVARAVQNGGWVASRDPLLAFPRGALDDVLPAPIPWPPGYDLILAAVYRGALPDIARLGDSDGESEAPVAIDARERAKIERFVASAPRVFGALTAFFAALLGAALVGASRPSVPAATGEEGAGRLAVCLAAAIAGIGAALTYGHVRYSHLGNGDHHAFISLLHVILLWSVTRSLRIAPINQPFLSAVRGSVAGVISGLMMISWTASILWVALIQLCLLVRLFSRYQAPDGRRLAARGLPVFATSFHKGALLVLLPVVIESPFTTDDPWSVVNLSWFPFAWLCIGWLVFAPYALVPKIAASRPWAALLPAAVTAAFVLLATGTLGSLGAAFSWAGADNPFMATITESQSPLSGAAGPLSTLIKFAGIGVLLSPLVILGAAAQARRVPAWLPAALVLPALLAMGLLQRRFLESFGAPFSAAMGAWVVLAFPRVSRRASLAGIVVVGAVLMHFSTLQTASKYRSRSALLGHTAAVQDPRFPNNTPVAQHQRAIAELLGVIRAEAEARADGQLDDLTHSSGSVLAQWDLGHAIEWRAQCATVATNFGIYVGEDSFLAPFRFFGEKDPVAAEALLRELGVEYVLVDGARNLSAICEAVGLAVGDDGLALDGTMLYRLIGVPASRAQVPPFLTPVAERTYRGVGDGQAQVTWRGRVQLFRVQ